MKSFLIVDNDVVIKDGDFVVIQEKDVVLQEIERTLSTRKGEWFLNAAFGMDYSEIEKKQPDEEMIKLYVMEAIWQIDGVEEVKELKVHFNSIKRAFNISFQIVLKGDEIDGRNYEIRI